MDVKFHQQGQVTIATLVGDMDPAAAKNLQTELNGHITQGRVKIAADISQVAYISSIGFRVLLAALKECRAKGGDFVIAAPQRNIAQLLEVSGFTNLLKVYPTTPDAIAALGA